MTCDCLGEELCGTKACGVGLVCQKRILNFREMPVCVPKPICQTTAETYGLSRRTGRAAAQGGEAAQGGGVGGVVDCAPNGEFRPLQCNYRLGDCWCVDDRGVEVDGTRNAIFTDEHKPSCVRNVTVALTINMLLVPTRGEELDGDSLPDDKDIVKALPKLSESIGSWLVMDKQYVTVIRASSVVKDGVHGVLVMALVRHDGSNDLPSAVTYMTGSMFLGHCTLAVAGQTLTADPHTLQVNHKFSYPWKEPEPVLKKLETGPAEERVDMWWRACLKRSYVLLAGGLVATLILLASVSMAVIMVTRRRRQRRSAGIYIVDARASQISTSSEKSVIGEDDEARLLANAEHLTNEKTPLA